MERKNKENNSIQIFYADLTPCDEMHSFIEPNFVPSFVTEDTKEFDDEPPLKVVLLATRFGWCIVSKWGNNGSTRIYGQRMDAVVDGIEILHEISCCWYAFDTEAVYSKNISFEDNKVFFGRNNI